MGKITALHNSVGTIYIDDLYRWYISDICNENVISDIYLIFRSCKYRGANQLSDKPTAWQPTRRHVLVNWATKFLRVSCMFYFVNLCWGFLSALIMFRKLIVMRLKVKRVCKFNRVLSKHVYFKRLNTWHVFAGHAVGKGIAFHCKHFI